MLRPILYRVRRNRLYGKFSQMLTHLRFWSERWMFGMRQKIAAKGISTLAVYGIARLVLCPVFSAAVALALLIALPLGMACLPWCRGLASWLGAPLATTGHVDLLAAIPTITGAFLALYFTAISVVASTSSSAIPRATRLLFVDEVVGSTYLKAVAHLRLHSRLGLFPDLFQIGTQLREDRDGSRLVSCQVL